MFSFSHPAALAFQSLHSMFPHPPTAAARLEAAEPVEPSPPPPRSGASPAKEDGKIKDKNPAET